MAIDLNGNIFVADRANHRIRRITPNGVISTVAGSSNSGGFSGDGGPGASARLNAPQSVALDAAGNLYIADTFNQRVRKLSPDGVITTIAGNGSASDGGDGGPATAAQLSAPYDLAFDDAGNLYVSTSSRVRKITPQGVISTFAGGGAVYGGEGAPATSVNLSNPTGLTFDRAGVLYIADRNNRAIRAVSPNGAIRTVVRSTEPTDLASDAAGTIFVAESQRITRIAKFPAGDNQPPVIAITSPTTAPTYATAAQYFQVRGTASDNTLVVRIGFSNDRNPSGPNIRNLIGENAAQAESEIGAMRISSDERSAVSWQVDPQLKPGINRLTFTAWDVMGNSGSAQLTVNYKPFGLLETFAGKPGEPGSNDATTPRGAQFYAPRNLAFDSAGNLFVADTGNHRIRKITQAGVVSTVAGNGSVGFSGDGGAATAAALNEPRGLAIDPAGNLYFADSLNHRIRKVSSAGVISTVAGTGEDGFSGDEGPAMMARLNMPLGVVVDTGGNLYIADTNNRRIRKVAAASGVITTVAEPNYSSSQVFPAPGLNYPAAIALDREGNLLIADRDASRIYKLTPTGALTTIAGDPNGSLGDDGIPALKARIDQPIAVTSDPIGNIFLVTQAYNEIRRVTPDGLIYTVPRAAVVDAESLVPINVAQATGLAIDRAGKVYIADPGNHRIAVLTLGDFPPAAAVSAASFAIDKGLSTSSIVAVFGANMAASTEAATTLPLPYSLAGTTVAINRGGVEYPAQLFFVSPSQINLLVPDDPALIPGFVRIIITNSQGEISVAPAQIYSYAPALFSANADGQGVAAAVALRVKADGSQSYEPVGVYDPAQNKFVSLPIDLGPPTDQVYLILFGTGFHKVEYLREVVVLVGGVPAQVLYAGAQGGFAGLDQINLLLPRNLAGRGEVDISVTVVGRTANTIRVQFK